MRTGYLTTAALGLAGIAALVACTPPQVSARADYQDYCAGCHGANGKGDGAAAPTTGKRPADLTLLAARNGGTFPTVRVMSTIDGYTRRDTHGATMPEFGPLLEAGDLVLYETTPGVMTPTPSRLLALAQYLEGIQQ